MPIRAVLIGALVAAAGCTPAPGPPAAGPGGAPGATTGPGPAAPAFRWFDAAADTELREAHGVDRRQRDAAEARYAGQRWRFRGTAGALADGHAVVRADGVAEPVFVYFRSPAEAGKVKAGGAYLFEATAGDWVSRRFRDAVLVEAGGP